MLKCERLGKVAPGRVVEGDGHKEKEFNRLVCLRPEKISSMVV